MGQRGNAGGRIQERAGDSVTITQTPDVSFEECLDVIAEIMISPEFAKALEHEHNARRRKIPFRIPEWVYTEDVDTPDGYPCCELLAITVDDDSAKTAQALKHEISCQWTVNGDDSQIMGRELKRLIAATRDCFRAIKLTPQLGGHLTTGRVDFGPVATARAGVTGVTGKWVKSASIEMWWNAFARESWQR